MALTAEQRSLLAHGLALRPRLAGASELSAALETAGLGALRAPLLSCYEFARQAHQGQVRDDGTPYEHHLARTALLAIEELGLRDLGALQAALLHDVVEDTSVTAEQIAARFGSATAERVQRLSKPERQPGESYDQRTTRYLAQLESSPLGDLVALKLADRMDNLEDTHLMPDRAKVDRYLRETREQYLPLAQRSAPRLAERLRGRLEVLEGWRRATV